MMASKLNETAMLALAGLVIGCLLGILASGGYATWARGGDVTNIGFTTIFAYLPASWMVLTEPFRTAAMIGGAVALAMTVAVPALGVRRDPTSHGSARWATEAEIKRAKLLSDIGPLNGPVYGKLGTPKRRAKYLTSVSIPHSLIAAPTGAGKGVGIVTPTLLTYPGSILCLDMKGANYENTARHRRSIGDRVFKFAPYDKEGKTHRFNPLDDIAAADPRRRFTEARRLAASFITIKGDGAQGFLDGARDIFAATALLVIERGTPTIAAVHDALSQPGKSGANLFKLGAEVESREARSIFNKFSGRDDKHLSAYLSILMDGGLGIWADPMVRDATAATDFRIASLRSRPATIYIVIPPNDIEPLAPLVRLLFQQAVSILQRSMPDRDKGEKYPVLLLLDEFVSLGRMDNLKTAITTLREYEVRVMIVVQTISSMRDLYGRDGAGTFIANCGMQIFMGPADEETPDYISKAIGDFTQKTRSKSWKGGELSTSYSERTESARLIRPEQVRLLGETQIVALVQNMLPILAHRVTYYEDRELKKIFEAQGGDYPDPPQIPPYDPEPNPDLQTGGYGAVLREADGVPAPGPAPDPQPQPQPQPQPPAPHQPPAPPSNPTPTAQPKPAAKPQPAPQPEPMRQPDETAGGGSIADAQDDAAGAEDQEKIETITRRSADCDVLQAQVQKVRHQQVRNLHKHSDEEAGPGGAAAPSPSTAAPDVADKVSGGTGTTIGDGITDNPARVGVADAKARILKARAANIQRLGGAKRTPEP